MIYVLITVGLFLLRLAVKDQPRLNRQLYPLVLVLLTLFSAFRYEVGCDWSGYLNQYQSARHMTLDDILTRREAIWWLILHQLHQWDLAYPWANVISSVLAFGGIHVLARRQPDPLGFLVLLFPVLIINMPMSGIRQGVAVGLLCVAIARFLDGRMLAYAVWVLLASGFHSSALIAMLFVPLVGHRITRGRVLAMVLLAVPGALALLRSSAGEMAADRYIDTGIEAFGALFRVLLLVLSALYYLLFLRRGWRAAGTPDQALVTVGAVAMLGLGALLPVSSVIADRLSYYLMPVQGMMLARVPWLPGLRHRAVLATLPYLGMLAFFTVWAIQSWHFQKCYIPYQSWLLGPP